MKKWLLILCVVYSHITYAQHFSEQINQIINHNPNVKVGIIVFDLNSNKILYKKNENSLFIPASNMKLFSDAAALFAFGSNHRFVSKLTTDNNTVTNATLPGSIYLELSGDPSFTKENLKTLLSELKKLKINKISGDFNIVSKNQNITPYGPGWLSEDYKYDYAAPLSPLIINENRVTFFITPTKPGSLALVNLSENQGINLNNKVLTKNDKNCGVHFNIDESNNLTLQGCINPSQKHITRRIAVKNPTLYSRQIIKQLLQELGITLKGDIKLSTQLPQDNIVIAQSSSKPLIELIQNTLKLSDNLYAESLYLQAAAFLKDSEFSWDDAKSTIKDYIAKHTGINLKNAIIVDGSGLSRYNLLSPLQTMNLLRFIYFNFPHSYEYIAALPISGVDGTLQQRLKNQKGLVRAKTGAMKGVLSLSGFLQTQNYHTLVFAIFINSKDDKTDLSADERSIADKICETLITINNVS